MAIRGRYLETVGETPVRRVLAADWGAGSVQGEGETVERALVDLIEHLAIAYDVTKLRQELGV
jgi:hypothetical protein